jgi:hypothetical protein
LLQTVATCLGQQGHHQAKLLQKYIKDTTVYKGRPLFIFVTALSDFDLIGRKMLRIFVKIELFL